MILSWSEAVDIGGNRGRLALAAAQSLWRVDAAMRSAFGRAADINEAWRSPEQANANYARYRAYLRDPKNNPWAPIALPADESIHCRGFAVDTDDTSAAQMRIWNDHGWYWTVYRNGILAERWHLEYFPDRDNHRNTPAPAGDESEEDDMPDMNEFLNTPAFDGGPSISTMFKQTHELYNAMFKGGESMEDAGRSAAFSFGNLTTFADRTDKNVAYIVALLVEGGTDLPDGKTDTTPGKPLVKSIAEINAGVQALKDRP